MDKVAVEFHKNVLLLTQFIPPSDELKKHFKEGMFDKPNTVGFIHVSHYLLSVHYKDNVKNKIQWPVICKQTENKFRNDVRECLMIIANEHADMNFPPIFASNLLLAKGTKFLLIMWKFSLVVLRTYLTREHECVITHNPKLGPYQEITKTFLKNVSRDHCNATANIRKERERAEQEAKEYIRQKTQDLNELKSKMFKIKGDLKDTTTTAPVNDTAKKVLMNVDDNEIIDMWGGHIKSDIMSKMEADNQKLKKIDGPLRSIGNVLLNFTGNSQTLNALNFERINVEPLYNLVPLEMQVLPYSLYDKESLNFQSLFSIFNLLLQKYKLNLRKNPIEELAKCNTQLEMTNQDMRMAVNSFQNIHEQIVTLTMDEIRKKDQSFNSPRAPTNISEFDKVLFMPSPSIQLTSQYEGGRSIYQNDLKLTPVESAHKGLFSRHALNKEKAVYTTKLKPMSVQRINFDDSELYNTSSDKQSVSQQRIRTPTKIKSTFKNVNKYSRIFSTRKPNDNRVNNSMMMMMMSNAGSSMLPQMTKQQSISLNYSYNSSQEFSQEALLMNPNLNSTADNSRTEECEKVPRKSIKRRSIGDLVDRYKKLLQKRDMDSSQMANNPSREPLGEEENI